MLLRQRNLSEILRKILTSINLDLKFSENFKNSHNLKSLKRVKNWKKPEIFATLVKYFIMLVSNEVST